MPNCYFYIIMGHKSTGEITGVPNECDGRVFMGPCMPIIRAKAKVGDWIIGFSSSKITPKKILSVIEVGEKITFAEAYKKYPQAIWSKENERGQIYCKPLRHREDGTWEYEPIEDSPHQKQRLEKDVKGNRDAFIVGSNNSVIFGSKGIPIPDVIMGMLREKRREATKDAPFGRDKNGRPIGKGHRCVSLKESDIIRLKDLAQKAKKL